MLRVLYAACACASVNVWMRTTFSWWPTRFSVRLRLGWSARCTLHVPSLGTNDLQLMGVGSGLHTHKKAQPYCMLQACEVPKPEALGGSNTVQSGCNWPQCVSACDHNAAVKPLGSLPGHRIVHCMFSCLCGCEYNHWRLLAPSRSPRSRLTSTESFWDGNVCDLQLVGT